MPLLLLPFNDLLLRAGADPALTRLVRHQSARGAAGKSPADLWRAQDGSFERYLEFQSGAVFGPAKFLAVFLPAPAGTALFVGLYRILSKAMVTDPSWTCPVNGHSVIDHHYYTTERMDSMDHYVDRLVIEWGGAPRRWVQNAHIQNKPILEVRQVAAEDPYPGHIHFISTIRALNEVPSTWKSNLQNARGVYLLISMKNGKQYVGSAVGAEGFWGRWMEYARDGHGGNLGMKDTADDDYQVSILEVASSSATEPDIVRLEHLWMMKLMSTSIGLNTPMGKKTKQTS
jgi:hypothetical protein